MARPEASAGAGDSTSPRALLETQRPGCFAHLSEQLPPPWGHPGQGWRFLGAGGQMALPRWPQAVLGGPGQGRAARKAQPPPLPPRCDLGAQACAAPLSAAGPASITQGSQQMEQGPPGATRVQGRKGTPRDRRPQAGGKQQGGDCAPRASMGAQGTGDHSWVAPHVLGKGGSGTSVAPETFRAQACASSGFRPNGPLGRHVGLRYQAGERGDKCPWDSCLTQTSGEC